MSIRASRNSLMSAFSGMLLIKACNKKFKEVLVLYGIIQAAFSYTVFNALQMSLSELPCVFIRDPGNLPRENWEEFAQTLLTVS